MRWWIGGPRTAARCSGTPTPTPTTRRHALRGAAGADTDTLAAAVGCFQMPKNDSIPSRYTSPARIIGYR